MTFDRDTAFLQIQPTRMRLTQLLTAASIPLTSPLAVGRGCDRCVRIAGDGVASMASAFGGGNVTFSYVDGSTGADGAGLVPGLKLVTPVVARLLSPQTSFMEWVQGTMDGDGSVYRRDVEYWTLDSDGRQLPATLFESAFPTRLDLFNPAFLNGSSMRLMFDLTFQAATKVTAGQ